MDHESGYCVFQGVLKDRSLKLFQRSLKIP